MKIEENIKCDEIEFKNKFVSFRVSITNFSYFISCIKTWLDKKKKLGWTLLPKCASTAMRVIQLVKSGFYSGHENFKYHKAKEMWPVIAEKHHVDKYNARK